MVSNEQGQWWENEKWELIVDQLYDKARGIGLQALGVLLGTVIVMLGVPIAFYDSIKSIYLGKEIAWLWGAWIFLLLSLLSGFLVFLFIFEGYYHFAHREDARLIRKLKSETEKYHEQANDFFDRAHYAAIFTTVFFVVSLLLVIFPTVCNIIKTILT